MERLLGTIQVDAKCNYRCPCKREVQGDLTTEQGSVRVQEPKVMGWL